MIQGRIEYKTWMLIIVWVATGLYSLKSSAQSTISSTAATPAPLVAATIATEGDSTNLQFLGKDSWEYKVERVSPTEIVLTVPKVKQESLGKLVQFDNPSIKKIESLPTNLSESSKFKIILQSSDYEHFDYLTDQPSRLIIDFYKKEASANTEVAQANTQNATVSTVASQTSNQQSLPKQLPAKKIKGQDKITDKTRAVKIGNNSQKTRDRAPASSELLVVEEPEEISKKAFQFLQGIFDAGDESYNRFKIKSYEIKEEAIIASKNNIYIRFPILKLPTTRLEFYKNNPPEFVIEPKQTPENKEARLLKTFHDNKRWAAFLKTYDLFQKKFPDTQYEEILKHLAAQVHYQLWLRDKNPSDYKAFNDNLNFVAKKYIDSPLRERTEMLIAAHDLERGSGLETLQRYQKLLQMYPNSRERDWIKKGIAEGYLILNKYDEALQTYIDLEKSFINESGGIEGTYRKGDVYFQKRDYKNAELTYKEAIKKQPNYQAIFPNAYYNLAESQFWLGEYKESLEHFLTFVRLFPSHNYGGFALTRIGELLEILGADQEKVLGAFLESQFRFQGSDGAKIARIRTLSQRMQGMRDAELKKTENEFYEIAETVNLPKIHEFVTLMRADGYHNRGEYKKAYDGLIEYYQKNPTTTNLEFFQGLIISYIADDINQIITSNRFIEALSLLDSFGKNWLLNTSRYDIPYFLARSYEQSGLIKDAEVIYKDLLAKTEKIKGTQEEKEKRVTEYYPTTDRLHLRLSNVLKEQKKYTDALQSLSRIKSDDSLSKDELIEKIEIASKLFEVRDEPKNAVQYLTQLKKSWSNDPTLVSQVNLRLSKQLLNLKDAKSALAAIAEIEKANSINEPMFTKNTLTLKADALIADGQPVAAVETYLKVLNEFEALEPMPSLRFKTGKILYDQGDIRGAEKIWEQIKGPSSEVYKNLAQERLNDLKWKDEYKKYIDRIPATKDIKSVR